MRALLAVILLMTAACSPPPTKAKIVTLVVEPNGQLKRDGKPITQAEMNRLLDQSKAGTIALGILTEPSNGKQAAAKRRIVKIGIVNAPLTKD